jgi:hypothetical protein
MREYRFRNQVIKGGMMTSIRNYVNRGVLPGSFLQAVISNDFSRACFNADDENLANLLAFAGYFYNEVPSECWGSRHKMLQWISRSGQTMIEQPFSISEVVNE